MKFFAQQKLLSLSECQRLCAKSSRDVEELAHRVGWNGIPGSRLSVSVATGLNMLALSTGMNHGLEPRPMAAHLPGLRNEALLNLGEDASNWSFEGTSEAERQFWPMLYGVRDTVRPRIAPLLGSSLSVTTRELRFYSEKDVECLSLFEFEQGDPRRAPRFLIDSHVLASQLRSVCGSPLFTTKVATTG